MPLAPGSRLGSYEILSALGAGGMGEVYRARDAKLNRDVAIKILLPAVAGDAERLARFSREAQVLAALNHPGIAQIFGLEQDNGLHPGTAFIVMELVGGDELAQRIAGGPMPLDEVIPIAAQIAHALEAAHEQAIIHRDLKPANIKIRDDGTVKVLDFGLAKALDSLSLAGVNVNAATITTPAMMTGVGVVLGTAAYMSPEQAKGRNADKRSDVWSFGCVLYEMLSGTRAFPGEDVADTLAAVLRAEPDWSALPADTPPAVRILIARCLVKDRRQRIGDLSTATFVLANTATLASERTGLQPVAAARISRATVSMAVAIAVLVAAALAGAVVWALRPSVPATPVVRFSLALDETQRTSPISRHGVAIAPDGSRLAFVGGGSHLFIRSASDFDARTLVSVETDVPIFDPVFSPDGQTVAFFSAKDRTVKRIGVTGGAPVTVCPSAGTQGMTWSAGGIVIGQPRGVFRCSSSGGAPEQLATVAFDEQVLEPQMLPGGTALLFTIAKAADGPSRWDRAQVVVQTIATGARKVVVDGGSDARYVSSGHLIYAIGGTVFGVPFDAARQLVTGTPVNLIDGVRRETVTGAAQFDVSHSGTLLYVPGPAGVDSAGHLLAVQNRAGELTRLSVPPGPYVHVRASRDGAHLAVGSDDGRDASVWIYALDGTTAMRRLVIDGQNRFPIWSPDSQSVAFQSIQHGSGGIFSQRADGTGPLQRLTTASAGESHVPESWSPDGRSIAYAEKAGSFYSLRILSLADSTSTSIADARSIEPTSAVFSPDGRWIASGSNPTAELVGTLTSVNRGVYIWPFPAGAPKYPLPRQSLDYHPVWGPKGTELFFVPNAAAGRFVVIPVTTSPTVAFGSPATMPAKVTADRRGVEARAFDILPDGRFVGLVSASDDSVSSLTSSTQIRVVLNWFENVRALAGASK